MKTLTIKRNIVFALIPLFFLLVPCANAQTVRVEQYRTVQFLTPETVALALAAKGYESLSIGDFNGAITALRKGYSICPGHMKNDYAQALGAVYGIRGLDSARKGYINSSIRDLENSKQMMPVGPEREFIKEVLAYVYTMRGAASELSGDDAGALLNYLIAMQNLMSD